MMIITHQERPNSMQIFFSIDSLKGHLCVLGYIFYIYFIFMEVQPVDCPKVPKDFHLKIRHRFLTKLKKVCQKDEHYTGSLSLYKGIVTLHKNYDDVDVLPQQESTFWYFFGVKEADCYAIIHHDTGKTILFVPQLSEAYKLWMIVKEKSQYKHQYSMDEVHYTHELRKYLQDAKPTKLYIFSGQDTDSSLKVDEPEQIYMNGFNIDRQLLWPVISNLRVIKTPQEIQLIRYVCKVTSDAEKIAARTAKPGLTQMQLHAVFQFQHSIRSGSVQLGFCSICSSGRDCATLHYVSNEKIIEPDQMVLLDLGGKWYGYVADQAMTFPVSGKFTQKQRQVYTAVYEAQKVVEESIKPGVKWDDMHILAQKVLLKHLILMGIVKEAPIQELVEKRVGAIFFPHGLGHLFGLKVHDIGGYTQGPQRSKLSGLSKLRTRRVLQEGMCITVQPGLYFIDFMLQKALKDPELSPYLNADKIQEYKSIGGVRLQDDVVITKDGYELLSSLPRTIEDVEALLSKK